MAKIEEKVQNLVEDSIKEKGYNIYDIEYSKEGSEYYLRIFIEKENGDITIEDCEKVNDIVNPLLDEADIIKEQYYLEVSSIGVERNLKKQKHYERAIGEKIRVKLFKKDEDGNKEIEGILQKIENKEITIEKNGKTVKVNMNDIAQAKTIYFE